MDKVLVATGKVRLKAGAGWSFAGGFNGEITISVSRSCMKSEQHFAALAKDIIESISSQLPLKAYTADGFDATPGVIGPTNATSEESTLSRVIRVNGAAVAIESTHGDFNFTVLTPSFNASATPLPSPTPMHAGTWDVVSTGHNSVRSGAVRVPGRSVSPAKDSSRPRASNPLLTEHGYLSDEGKKRYETPSDYRVGVREKVHEQSRSADGKVYDPLEKVEIPKNGEFHLAHKEGMEHWKHKLDCARLGKSREAYMDEFNDPNRYRAEFPQTNRSRILEDHSNYFKDWKPIPREPK